MIAIIDYKMGNVRSVQKAFELYGEQAIITDDKEKIMKADKLVLPGVGSFRSGMENLKGLKTLLDNEVLVKKKPFLGICLGMQLLGTIGYEDGETHGLGWISSKVIKFDIKQRGMRKLLIPHVGWNEIAVKKHSDLFKGISKDWNFYFVHSYHMVCDNEEDILATCDYGIDFVSAVNRANVFGTQFHPEKSQKNGLQIIENFIDMNMGDKG